jgi:23S rRNA pseudouridine2605 synthase
MPAERLQKILSRAGIASRRASEEIINEGRVTLNGEVVRELGTKADIQTDDVRVDGVRVKPPERPVYLLLNKPKGVVSTRHDPQGRQTVMDLVPAVAGLFPVGRLDVTTEGLILLTNDGGFAEQVAHPRYEVPRVYQAKVRGVPDRETLGKLKRGVRVEGDLLTVDHARVVESDNNAWVELTLHEGKHHEVKRMLEAVGHPVSKLKRVALGSLTVKGLEPGQFRSLTPQEVTALRRGAPSERPRTPRIRHPRPARGRKPSPPRTDGRTGETRKDQARTDQTRTNQTRTDQTRTNATRTNATRADQTRTNATRTDQTRTASSATGAAATPRTGDRRPGFTRSERRQGPKGNRRASGSFKRK